MVLHRNVIVMTYQPRHVLDPADCYISPTGRIAVIVCCTESKNFFGLSTVRLWRWSLTINIAVYRRQEMT